MFYVILILILVLIAGIAYGTWMRKKTYAHIDRIESWKSDIMNRPVTEEIARVKELKMVGETEKKFESWRTDWDEIVTSELPRVEEQLFDAEEAADKYRFNKAQRILNELELQLQSIEENIKEMLHDLNEVVDSEQQNRKDIISIKETYHAVKKEMITKRSQFKNAVAVLEEKLREIDGDFKAYEADTETGDYIKARETLISVKSDLEQLAADMAIIPKLYKEIDYTLPDQLKELYDAYEEMTEQGYVLRQLQLNDQMKEMDKQLLTLSEAMEQKAYHDTSESINTMHQQIDWLFQQMEKEVIARKQLRETAPFVKQDLMIVTKKVTGLNEEIITVQESYRIDEDDLKTQIDIRLAFEKIEKEFSEVQMVLEEKQEAFTIILEKIEHMKHEIDILRDSADEFEEKIHTLRKDELLAKDTLGKLKKKIFEAGRLVQKSNMPGVPHSFLSVFEESEELLNEVDEKLQQKPLEMSVVQQVLDETESKVNLLHEKAISLVESAELSEQLIQYGNRYKSRYPEINEELKRAEDYFRSYNYQESVEISAAAIQRVEPDILKKIDLYEVK